MVKEITSPPIQNQSAHRAPGGALYTNVNRSIKGQSSPLPNATASRYKQNEDATHSPYEILPHDTAEDTASGTRYQGAQVVTNGVSLGGQAMPNITQARRGTQINSNTCLHSRDWQA